MLNSDEDVALEARRLLSINQEKTKELIIKKLKKSSLIEGKFTTKKLAKLLQASESTVRKWFNKNSEHDIPLKRLLDIAILLNEQIEDICVWNIEEEFSKNFDEYMKQRQDNYSNSGFYDFLYMPDRATITADNYLLHAIRRNELYKYQTSFINDVDILLHAITQLNYYQLKDVLSRVSRCNIKKDDDLYVSKQLIHYMRRGTYSKNKEYFKLLIYNKNDKFNDISDYIDALGGDEALFYFNEFTNLDTIFAMLYLVSIGF